MKSHKTNGCSKSGIKIHESDNNCEKGYDDDQFDFYNKIKNTTFTT